MKNINFKPLDKSITGKHNFHIHTCSIEGNENLNEIPKTIRISLDIRNFNATNL